MSKFLVVGSSGQIGTAFMRICRKRSIAATGLDMRPNRWDRRLTDLHLNFLEYNPDTASDITDIIFLATHPSARELEENSLQNEKDYKVFHHAKQCAKIMRARLSIVSSRELFGIEPDEINSFNAESVYEKQKKDFENELYALRADGYHTGVLRAPIVFGGYDTDIERIPRMVPRWCQQILLGKSVGVTDPDKTVQLELADNVARTLLNCLLENNKSFLKEIFGVNITLGNLAKLIEEVKQGKKKNGGALEMLRQGIDATLNSLRKN